MEVNHPQRVAANITKRADQWVEVELEVKPAESNSELAVKKALTAKAVHQHTEILIDPLHKVAVVLGPLMEVNSTTRYELQAFFGPDNLCTFRLHIWHSRLWKTAQFHEAYDFDGQPLELLTNCSSIPSYPTTLEFAKVVVSHQMLKESQATGFPLKLYGRREDLMIIVAPHYLIGFLGKVHESGLMTGGEARES